MLSFEMHIYIIIIIFIYTMQHFTLRMIFIMCLNMTVHCGGGGGNWLFNKIKLKKTIAENESNTLFRIEEERS